MPAIVNHPAIGVPRFLETPKSCFSGLHPFIAKNYWRLQQLYEFLLLSRRRSGQEVLLSKEPPLENPVENEDASKTGVIWWTEQLKLIIWWNQLELMSFFRRDRKGLKVRVLKWRSPLKPPKTSCLVWNPMVWLGWLFKETGPQRPPTSVVSVGVGIHRNPTLECLPGSENAKQKKWANLPIFFFELKKELWPLVAPKTKKITHHHERCDEWMITGDTWRLEIDSPCLPTLLKPQPSEHGTKSRDNRRQRAISFLSSTFQSWSSPSATSENIWSILIKSDQRANWPHFLLRLWSLGHTWQIFKWSDLHGAAIRLDFPKIM